MKNTEIKAMIMGEFMKREEAWKRTRIEDRKGGKRGE